MNKDKKTFLVTGGYGFIGSHVVDNLVEEGHDVVIIDKLTYAGNVKNVNYNSEKNVKHRYLYDINNTKKLKNIIYMHKPDVIIHLAAETHVDNSIKNCDVFVHSNINGTLSLLEACKETKTKICHISTDEVYGPANDEPFVETDLLNPMNPYAATKAAAEHMIRSYANTFGIKYQILRPSNNFGKNQNKEKFLPKLISCILNKQKFPLYGNGLQEREWLYVYDNAKIITKLACLLADDKIVNETINVTTENMSTNIDMLKSVCALMNVEFYHVVEFVKDRPGHDKKYYISGKKLNNIVNVEKTSFNDALQSTIDNYTNSNSVVL